MVVSLVAIKVLMSGTEEMVENTGFKNNNRMERIMSLLYLLIDPFT